MSRPFNRLRRIAASTVLVSAIGLCICNPVFSKEGRDFAGYYAVSDVSDSGQDVRLKLSLRVFNFSGDTVHGATITLQDSVLLGTAYATISGDTIPEDGSINLVANITLPQGEYELWLSGGTPRLDITYQNGSGLPVHRLIELSPKPVEVE